MTYFIIAIVMYWMNPADIPYYDAIEVTAWQGEPLRFGNVGNCWQYIADNLQMLMDFGHAEFPDAHHVQTIFCVEKAEI